MSYAELLFEESLKFILDDNEEIIRNYRPIWLINNQTGYNLEYDFYLPRFKIAFEIQGPHHYNNSYQIYKDSIKEQLSESYGIRLYKVSIFQLEPGLIRKKILAYSFTVGRNFNIKPFDFVKTKILQQKIKRYRELIKDKYGEHDCQKPPHAFYSREYRHSVDEFLNHHTVFNLNIHGIITSFRYVGKTNHKIIVEQSCCKGRKTLKYSAFRKLVQ